MSALAYMVCITANGLWPNTQMDNKVPTISCGYHSTAYLLAPLRLVLNRDESF